MKKLFLVLPLVILLAAGCDSSGTQNSATPPTQQSANQPSTSPAGNQSSEWEMAQNTQGAYLISLKHPQGWISSCNETGCSTSNYEPAGTLEDQPNLCFYQIFTPYGYKGSQTEWIFNTFKTTAEKNSCVTTLQKIKESVVQKISTYNLVCHSPSDSVTDSWYPHFKEQILPGWNLTTYCYNADLKQVAYLKRNSSLVQLGIYDLSSDQFIKSQKYMYAKGETCPSIMNWSKDGEIVFRCEMGEATNIVSYNNPSFPGEKSSLTLISGSIGHDFSKDPQ